MTTDYGISPLVESQFPEYVRDEGKNLVAFIKAYYQWMEQNGNVLDSTKNLLRYQDIDTTIEKYLEYIEREILQNIPKEVLVDKRLLAKHAKDFYRARGSERAFEVLFRILFNEEISFYYPGDDILRASDGRWVLETSVRVTTPSTGNIQNLINNQITGTESGAQAVIEKIIGTFEAGQKVDELFLIDVVGTFQDGELIRNTANTITATIVSQTGSVQSVDIINGGALHFIGDEVQISSPSATLAIGRISNINTQSAIKLRIDSGGSGYRVNDTVISLVGGSGFNAAFSVETISNTEIIQLNTDIISPFQNVVLNTGPTFVSLGANTSSVSANLASSNISSVLNSVLTIVPSIVGTINSISIDNYGYGYSTLPSLAQARDEDVLTQSLDDGNGGKKGFNAILTPIYEPTAIGDVSVTIFGSGFNKNETVNITNITRQATQATGFPQVSGLTRYAGKYVDTKGFLSWNNKLQDNYYYQEFSYEIVSTQFFNAYKRLIDRLSHPAGTIMFGRFKKINTIQNNILSVTPYRILYTEGQGTLTSLTNDIQLFDFAE